MWKFTILVFVFTAAAFAQKSEIKNGQKIIYKYKKYEKFDFDALDVSGNASSPGDLSIGPRFRPKFKNKLPERKNFHKEMKKAIDSLI